MEQIITLFYVDDDYDDLEFFKEVADSIGVHVVLFKNADELFAKLHNPIPKNAVIFLDLNMPVKSGFDIITEIKSSAVLLHLPLVVLSTASEKSIIEKCRKLGASLYMTKAVSVKELKKAIQYIIGIDWKHFNHDGTKFIYR